MFSNPKFNIKANYQFCVKAKQKRFEKCFSEKVTYNILS